MLALSTRRRKLTAVHVWLDNKNSAARGEGYYHVGASSFSWPKMRKEISTFNGNQP
jgi:hypothetical protein